MDKYKLLEENPGEKSGDIQLI